MDYAFQGKHPPTKLATMATVSNAAITQEQPWLANSVATDHVTSNLIHSPFLILTMDKINLLLVMVKIFQSHT